MYFEYQNRSFICFVVFRYSDSDIFSSYGAHKSSLTCRPISNITKNEKQNKRSILIFKVHKFSVVKSELSYSIENTIFEIGRHTKLDL